MSSNIKLSICCISYNHAHFISQALDSFLAQRVNFEFELVISDDKSTDDTAQIIEEYAAMYPEKIRVITRDSNVGMNVNFFSTLSACKGEYIAICEGDDYWIDEYKLKKQVAILDSDRTISIVTHNVHIINETFSTSAYVPYTLAPKPRGGFDEVLFNHFIPTLSIVLRRDALPNYWPDFFYKIKSPDKALALSLLLKGDYYHCDENMGVYRHHDGGITKRQLSAREFYNQESYLYKEFFNFFKINKKKKLAQKLAYVSYSSAIRAFLRKKYLVSLLFLIKSLYISPAFFINTLIKRVAMKIFSRR